MQHRHSSCLPFAFFATGKASRRPVAGRLGIESTLDPPARAGLLKRPQGRSDQPHATEWGLYSDPRRSITRWSGVCTQTPDGACRGDRRPERDATDGSAPPPSLQGEGGQNGRPSPVVPPFTPPFGSSLQGGMGGGSPEGGGKGGTQLLNLYSNSKVRICTQIRRRHVLMPS